MDDIERFRSKVDQRGPDDCWPWRGGRDDAGYGLFYFHDDNGKLKRTRAHRWLLGYLRGKPLILKPTGVEEGCHRCDNEPCCNPAHLYVGTRKQNIGDAVERKRLWQLRTDVCPSGHPLDGVKTQKGKRRRYCKTCERDGSHQRRTVNRTHCKNKHLLSGDNVIICKNGTRKCRICDAARTAGISPDQLAAARATRRKAA
jgi:hypothetical protein